MPSLEWADEPAPVTCLVCGYTGDGTLCAEILGAAQPHIRVVRCPDCDSVMLDVETIAQYTDVSTVDTYIESAGSIDAIARNLFYIDPKPVKSFLDVGCHYGFGMHVGREILGWHVEGIEPGAAARRGAVELDLDIRDEFLSEETKFDSDFDLIVASEVVEHVPDPVGFLQAIRSKIAPGGHAVFTTPAAEAVEDGQSKTEAIIALSPGDHVFLASARGLERMLSRAGWSSFTVLRDGRSLRAIASTTPGEHIEFGDFGPDRASLLRYYDKQATIAAEGSALESGMASRHFRALVDGGGFDTAEASRLRAAAAIRERHGLDLDDPARAEAGLDSGLKVPWNAIPVAYYTGMMHLTGTRDSALAARFFDLAVRAAEVRDSQAGMIDGDSSNLRLNAYRHLALALARSDPSRAPGAIARLSEHDSPESTAHWTLETFRELIVYGETAAAAVLASQTASGGNGGAVAGLLGMATAEYGVCLARRDYRRAASLAPVVSELSRAQGGIGARRHVVLVLMRRPRVMRALRSAYIRILPELRRRLNPLNRP